MDPDATLRDLIAAAQAGDALGVRTCAAELADWIERGGFAPSELVTL